MKKRMTVEMLLKSLNVTAEERELHKDLIQTCLENERKIAESHEITTNNLAKISFVLEHVFKNMIMMEEALRNLARTAEEMSLRMLPSSEFHHE